MAGPALPDVNRAAAPHAPAPHPAAPAAKPAPAAAKPAPNAYGISTNSALAQPGQVLSGQALIDAAKALADAQTVGPMQELARQIAQSNTQTQNAQALTNRYFTQLGAQGQQGVNQEQAIAGGLNQQLQGIAGDENQQLRNIGQTASRSFYDYAPQGSGGIGTPAMQGLATELARQQGLAAQDEGMQRAFGARQGANYSSLGASQIATGASRGQEMIGDIGRAGQLKVEPMKAKQAALAAQNGALFATDVGKLRQQEIANAFTSKGLGIKQTALALTAAQNAAKDALTARGQNVTIRGQDLTAKNQQGQLQVAQGQLGVAQQNANTRSAAQQALDWYHQAQVNLRSGAGSQRPLSPAQNNQATGALSRALEAIPHLQQAGQNEQTIRAALAAGSVRDNHGKPIGPVNPSLVEAAYELLGYGSVDQSTAAQMYTMGLRNTTWYNPHTGRTEPLKVTKNFTPTSSPSDRLVRSIPLIGHV